MCVPESVALSIFAGVNKPKPTYFLPFRPRFTVGRLPAVSSSFDDAPRGHTPKMSFDEEVELPWSEGIEAKKTRAYYSEEEV